MQAWLADAFLADQAAAHPVITRITAGEISLLRYDKLIRTAVTALEKITFLDTVVRLELRIADLTISSPKPHSLLRDECRPHGSSGIARSGRRLRPTYR